jgi:hypothetical protein
LGNNSVEEKKYLIESGKLFLSGCGIPQAARRLTPGIAFPAQARRTGTAHRKTYRTVFSTTLQRKITYPGIRFGGLYKQKKDSTFVERFQLIFIA